MKILQFDEVYKIPLICLKINRAHPAIEKTRFWVVQSIFMYSSFTLTIITIINSLISYDIKESNFGKACTDGVFMVVWGVISFQYGVLLWFRDDLNELIRICQENFNAVETLTPEGQAIIEEYAYRGRWVCRFWATLVFLNYTLFPGKAIFLTLYSKYQDDFKLAFFFDCTYPPILEDIKNRYDVYAIIFFIHNYYGLYAIAMYIGFIPMGPVFIINTCAQIELMKTEVSTIFKMTPYNKKLANEKIAALVKRSQDIYSLVELINHVFMVFYEFSLKASATILPFTLYQVIDGYKRNEVCVEYIGFIITGSLLCYIPCYYSDLLMEKGEDLRLAIYDSGWENQLDIAARNSVIIMLTMAVRPISIRTIFRIVCLDAFAGLCHEAYALFSLLNAMWG